MDSQLIRVKHRILSLSTLVSAQYVPCEGVRASELTLVFDTYSCHLLGKEADTAWAKLSGLVTLLVS